MTTTDPIPAETRNAIMRAARQAFGADIPDAVIRRACENAINNIGLAGLAARPIDEAELANDFRQALAEVELAKRITSAFHA